MSGKKESNEEFILNEVRNISSLCRTTLSIVENQPSRPEVKLWINEAIQNHEKTCESKLGLAEVSKQSSENTGIIKTLALGARNSRFAPRKTDPIYLKVAKILVPLIIALSGGGVAANHFLGFFK